jgi:hypothetical protein
MLQQPGKVFVHDERDACAREHPDEICGQTTIEPYEALVRPGVRDRGWDSAVVRARKHRVVLKELVSWVRSSTRRTTDRGTWRWKG